ncbi:MAG: hypothetical protein WCD31_09615 [Gillisia sp.]
MAQELREMFRKEEAESASPLKRGHSKRFKKRLEAALPTENRSAGYMYLKIAAVFMVAVAVAGFFYLQPSSQPSPAVTSAPTEQVKKEKTSPEEFKLRDISPEFKKVENYYMASINVELAKLEINQENKELIDSFMVQLAGLDKEYKRLNSEINENGINQQTVEAMITNLQMRLQLLLKLKNKLKELQLSKNTAHENLQA